MLPARQKRSLRFEPLSGHFFLTDVKPFVRRRQTKTESEVSSNTPDRLPLLLSDLIHKLEEERHREFRTEYWLRNEFNPEEPARFSIVDSRHYRSRTSDESGLMEWFVHCSPALVICDSEKNMSIEWSPLAYETVWEETLADEDLVRALHKYCNLKSMTWLGIYWNVTVAAYDQVTLIHHGRLDRHYADGSGGGGEGWTGFCLFIERLSMNILLPRVVVEHRLKRCLRMSAEISTFACTPPELSDLIVSFVFF